jgi:hypothetical protein
MLKPNSPRSRGRRYQCLTSGKRGSRWRSGLDRREAPASRAERDGNRAHLVQSADLLRAQRVRPTPRQDLIELPPGLFRPHVVGVFTSARVPTAPAASRSAIGATPPLAHET